MHFVNEQIKSNKNNNARNTLRKLNKTCRATTGPQSGGGGRSSLSQHTQREINRTKR